MLKEIVIFCFGGQGGVTAGRILALACVHEGLYAQAIPQFGAERRGALVRNYLRISDKPIRRHSSVKKADFIVVFAEKILNMVNIVDFAKADAVAILNSKPGFEGLKDLGLSYHTVEASEIALSLNLVSAGWPIVNTAMAGATSRVLGLSLESISKAVRETFKGSLADLNVKAVELAYERVR